MPRFCRPILTILLAAGGLGAVSDPQLNGTVKDENEAPVAGARITVRAEPPFSGRQWQAQTDAAGAFSLALPAPGDYRVDVERQGYYELKDRPVHIEAALELMLVINPVREVFQSISVNERPSPVDIAQTRNEERLTGTEINDIMYANSHSLRNAIQMMPGVVQDRTGEIHFNGSSESQVEYLLNGFNLADPISNQFHTTLPVEGVRSLDYDSGRYSPQYGKGTAGVLAISTENGTDAFHYTATDFIPGLRLQQGLRFGNWFPRLGISGPIVRGRAWFSDTFTSEYTSALITGLPAGQNTRSGWLGSNLLHTQVNVTARNILYADFLVLVDNEGRVGLAPLDPVSTTQNLRSREYFGSVKDQFYFGSGSLVEIGYAHNQFDNSQRPQGPNFYVFSTMGRSGNYFVTANQNATRDQWLVHAYAPQFHAAGTHQFEAGVDVDRLGYDGNFHRTGYDLLGLSGQLLSETVFIGPGVFHVPDIQVGSWILDTWRVSKRFQIDAGLRHDWDQQVSDSGWSPRLAFSWAPFRAARTRVTGGYSITHDAVPLHPFGRVLDQQALTTEFSTPGVPAGPPGSTTFTRGPAPLKLPRATNWSLGVDHQVSDRLTASVQYLRRRGTHGFDFVDVLAPDAPPSLLPLPNGASGGLYQLANLRRDNYDSVQITIHQRFSGQSEWMASYTRSRAQTNAVIDPNAAEPLQVVTSLIPMPWDTPNRFVGWTYLPLPFKNWAVAALVDARSGFPFSVQEQTGVVSGRVDSYRYPVNFDLNLSIERIVTLRGYRFAVRLGADNLTNQKNPTAVNNVIGSPQYLQFFGYEGRHFVARIRFFGRASGK